MIYDDTDEPVCPECGTPVTNEDDLCDRCQAIEDGDLRLCESCGEHVEAEELDDADVCRECREEWEHQRQLRSDYYASVL